MKTYNRKLDKARIAAELTVAGLAKKAGLNTSSLSRIINGLVNPHQRTKHNLATALSCDVAEIFGE